MPSTINAVLIIALLIAPGYIALGVVRRRTQLVQMKSDVEFVVATVSVGVLVQAMTFLWPGQSVLADSADRRLNNLVVALVYLVLVLLILPVITGVLGASLIQKHGHRLRLVGLDEATRISRSWNLALGRPEGMYVRVWLKGEPEAVVGGRFSTDSLASTDPAYQDLFIEEVWLLDSDDWFTQPSPNSAGVWLSPDSIGRIEFTKEWDHHG